MMCGALVHPSKKIVLPLAPEPIMQQDGTDKNDCERNASKRFLEDLRREHLHLEAIITEDGLASNAPHIELLRKLHFKFILGCKPGGILVLYGLHSGELPVLDVGEILIRGTFPELWSDPSIRAADWYGFYVQTYLERDVRRLTQVGDLRAFERFLRVCAARSGCIINQAEMASDCGVSHSTLQRWLSILEATQLIRFVQPYMTNLVSRVRKAPKLYFIDPGLAAYLMDFRDPKTILHSPQYGALFETLVYSNFMALRAFLCITSKASFPFFRNKKE